MGQKLELGLEWSSCLPQLTHWTAGSARSAGAGWPSTISWGQLPSVITLRPAWVVRVTAEQVSRRKLKCARTLESQAWNWHHMASTPSHRPKQITRPARFEGKERKLYLFVAGRQSHSAKGLGRARSPGLWPLFDSITDRVLLLQYWCSFGIGAMLLFISLCLLSRWERFG